MNQKSTVNFCPLSVRIRERATLLGESNCTQTWSKTLVGYNHEKLLWDKHLKVLAEFKEETWILNEIPEFLAQP